MKNSTAASLYGSFATVSFTATLFLTKKYKPTGMTNDRIGTIESRSKLNQCLCTTRSTSSSGSNSTRSMNGCISECHQNGYRHAAKKTDDTSEIEPGSAGGDCPFLAICVPMVDQEIRTERGDEKHQQKKQDQEIRKGKRESECHTVHFILGYLFCPYEAGISVDPVLVFIRLT